VAGDQVTPDADVVKGADLRKRRPVGARPVVVLLVTLIAAILGLNLVVLKVAIADSGPMTVQAFSAVVASATFFVVARASGSPMGLEHGRWPAALWVGLSLTVGSSLGVAAGVQRVDAGVAALLISTTPIITLILGTVILHERYSWHGVLGVLIGFLGVGVVGFSQRGGAGSELLGVVFMLLGALGWSLGLVLMRALAEGITRSTFIAWQTLLGVPFLLLAAGIFEGFTAEWSLLFALAVLYSGAMAKGTSFFLQLTVVRLGNATQASLTAFLMPVFGTLAGVLLLSEQVHPAQLYGGATILVGVALVLRARTEQPAPAVPST
jgi:drug/metabolite transporter (DMT)-like permease